MASLMLVLCVVMSIMAPCVCARELKIAINGNEFFGDGFIRNSLPDKPESLSISDAQSWRSYASSTIARMYRESGFLDAVIESNLEEQPEDEERVFKITFTIKENDPYTYDTIIVRNDDTLSPPIVPRSIREVIGERYTREQVLRSEQQILTAYGAGGYIHARVRDSMHVNPDDHTISAYFIVTTGRLAIFDSLIVRLSRPGGDSLPTMTKVGFLKSLVPYSPGDTVKTKSMNKVISLLQSSGIFTFVRLRDSLTSPETGRSSLLLEAEERSPGNLMMNVFYETEYGPGTRGDLRHRNLLGKMHEAGVRTTLALNKQSIQFMYGRPFIRRSPIRFDNTLQLSWYQLGTIHEVRGTGPFDGDREAVNIATFSRSFTSWLRGASATEFAARRFLADNGNYNEAINVSLSVQGFVSFVDSRLQPAKGWRSSGVWGIGGSFSAQNDSLENGLHTWVALRTAAYYPIIEQLIVAGRIDGGRFFGNAGFNADRFFLGGSRSVRSFGFNTLRPGLDNAAGYLGQNTTPAFYLASLELRFSPFAFGYISQESFFRHIVPLSIVPFVDYGKVWDVDLPFSRQFEGEGVAYGAGLRYPLFGIFNIRLDFAWGFDGGRNPAFAWVLDLAQAF